MKKGIALILMVLIVWEVWGQETHTVKQLNITKSDGTTNHDGVSLFRADELVDRAKLRLRMGDEYTSEFEIGYRYYKDGEWYSNFSLSGYGVGYFRSKLGVGIHKPEAMLHVVGGDIDIGNTDGEHLLRFRRKEDGAPIGQVGLLNTHNFKFAHWGGGGFFSFFTNYGSRVEERVRIANNGYVGIGTVSPDYLLDVNGTIRATEIKVVAQTADFVFEDNYPLKDLSKVETFIKENKHLPDIPSAAEMEASGVNLAEMNKLLLQKIEELTLYAIEKEKLISELIEEGSRQQEELDKLKQINRNTSDRLNRLEDLIVKMKQ